MMIRIEQVEELKSRIPEPKEAGEVLTAKLSNVDLGISSPLNGPEIHLVAWVFDSPDGGRHLRWVLKRADLAL